MAHSGTLHKYNKKLVAFEHASSSSVTSISTPDPPINTLLWIGGLGDGLLGVQYPAAIAASLPPSWRLAEVLLSSSYKGWATGSLKRDARELGQCVKYFQTLRGKTGKIALMGHSTGCQDCMEYLVGEGKEGREKVDGVVLQAGVSDREAWDEMASSDADMAAKLKVLVAKAKTLVDEGKGSEVLSSQENPLQEHFGAPCSAYRAWSLLAKRGDDDYFSSDLDDGTLNNTFGKIPGHTKIMIIWGGRDEFLPKGLDGAKLLGKWAGVVRTGGGSVDEVNGGIVEGASHNLNGDPEEVVQDLVGRVVKFIRGLGNGTVSESGGDARL